MLCLSFGLMLLSTAAAQKLGEGQEKEGYPKISLFKCTSENNCKKHDLQLVMDANWRWTHDGGSPSPNNCYEKNMWQTNKGKATCPKGGSDADALAWADKCFLEGISEEMYLTKYGVKSISKGGSDGVSMKFYNEYKIGGKDWSYEGKSTGARLYMLNGDNYEMFKLNNQEFAFDANMAQLQCGMNGAVYFIEMQANGGKGIGNNAAGALRGTGYCDAQCPHDIKYVDGAANCLEWIPNEKDKSENMGLGKYGACCNEMDIWEANAKSNAYTPHPCVLGPKHNKAVMYRCVGTECGDNDKKERYKGVCDKDGCDFASWRMGNKKFYGQGSDFKINTDKDLTQVTQFLTKDGTDGGELVEIRRWWRQDGKTFENMYAPNIAHCKEGEQNSLTDDTCESQNHVFEDYNHFKELGGMREMGDSLARGHVLAISLWDDVEVSMMWLDSWYPRKKEGYDERDLPDMPGISRGPCKGGEESYPTYVRSKYGDSVVEYWNFKVGCLGCTTKGVKKGKPALKQNGRRRKICKPLKKFPGYGDDDDDNDGGRSGKGGDRSGKGGDSKRRRRRSGKGGSRRRRRKPSSRRRRRRKR